MNVRPVKQVLSELASYVDPPRGVAIFLAESIPSSASDLNWVAIMGETSVQCNERFEYKVAGVRKSDPIVDWSGIDQRGERKWRIVRWISDIPPSAARSAAFLGANKAA
jgi:hypothetical protein